MRVTTYVTRDPVPLIDEFDHFRMQAGLAKGLGQIAPLPSDCLSHFTVPTLRTTQKDEFTTQKANEELIFATQKEEEATQKAKNTTQKPLTATQKAILDYLKAHSTATRLEVAAAIGNITEDGVKYNIGKLQQYGCLKREKGRKNGSWVVIDRIKN